MTKSQEKLSIKLLCGHFLRKVCAGSRSWYVLYDAKINPLQKIKAKTVERLDRRIDRNIKIWKKGKNGNIAFNLAMIRRLHGKHTLKRLYKKRQELGDSGDIYKLRIKKSKPRNEKIYNLFGQPETSA